MTKIDMLKESRYLLTIHCCGKLLRSLSRQEGCTSKKLTTMSRGSVVHYWTDTSESLGEARIIGFVLVSVVFFPKYPAGRGLFGCT